MGIFPFPFPPIQWRELENLSCVVYTHTKLDVQAKKSPFWIFNGYMVDHFVSYVMLSQVLSSFIFANEIERNLDDFVVQSFFKMKKDGMNAFFREIVIFDQFKKKCLLNGLDDIELTMKKLDRIKSFEDLYFLKFPWLGQ